MNYLSEEQAVFAFNIWDINSAGAVIDAAAGIRQNVIIQVSASNYKDIRKTPIRAFIHSYAKEHGIKAWLHLDHCRNIGIIEDAIEQQWDSVMIDASEYDIEKNIEITNRVTAIAHKNNVAVEAEIGQLKGVEDDIHNEKHDITDKDDIRKFLRHTDIDMIAVAFGNAHGIYQGSPMLDYELVEYTVAVSRIPFVVHGGSGLSEDIIKRLLSIQGVKKINISTDLKMAYRAGLMRAQQEGALHRKDFQPILVGRYIHDAIVHTAADKLRLLKTEGDGICTT